jgi:outer membrane lipoprotein SlyB
MYSGLMALKRCAFGCSGVQVMRFDLGRSPRRKEHQGAGHTSNRRRDNASRSRTQHPYTRLRVALTGLVAIALIAGCASKPPVQTTMSTRGSTLVRTAYVSEVRDVEVRGGSDSGIGAAIGAVLGSIVGSKIGSGHGRTATSIGGAVAGGAAGRHIEQSGGGSNATELTLRFDRGEVRTYRIEAEGDFRVGDTVKVITSNEGTVITH